MKKQLILSIFIFLNGLFYAQSVAKTVKIGKLEVSVADLVIPELQAKGMDPVYNYNDHVEYYLEDHPEWRLPTLDELISLYPFREKLGMTSSFYMAYGLSSNTSLPPKYSNQDCWVDYFSSGPKYDISFNTRCGVRLIKK